MENPLADPLLGKFMGPYRLVKVIARGSMQNRIYRAIDGRNNAEAAVKIINLFGESSKYSARFAQEIKAIRMLGDPSIVPILDDGNTDGIYYWYAMPYLGCGNLHERITPHQGWLPGLTCLIGTQVCRALTHAHERHIIHRDIKPANILIAGEAPAEVRLTDFGIARIEGEIHLTKTGARPGTPYYMSPEQVTGAPLDHRSDIYSLGCVLYTLLVGAPPFDFSDIRRVTDFQARVTPLSISVHNPAVPPKLISVIEQAMEKAPKHRFATAEAMRVALTKFVENTAALPPRNSRRLTWEAETEIQ